MEATKSINDLSPPAIEGGAAQHLAGMQFTDVVSIIFVEEDHCTPAPRT